jgi:endonuclease/exonuclease/phosphatase family metal-dependent hydrolase
MKELFAVFFIVATLLSQPVLGKELGTIKILTYNIFGVFVAPDRKARAELIGKEIAKLNPDVIGFQEAFNSQHREIILQGLEKSGWGKPYSFYQKKWYGPGAWIVSKYPFEQTAMLVYPVNGTAFDSDYYAKKGAAYARIKTPFGPLDFFTTHMIARYTNDRDRQGNIIEEDWIKSDRLLQAEQMAWFIQKTSKDSKVRSLVAVGDFNSPPVLLEYGLLKNLSGLVNTVDEIGIANCSDKIDDCKLENRIDHVFYQNYPASSGFYLKPVNARIVFHEKVSNGGKALKMSDHEGLLVEFAALSSDDPAAKIGDRNSAMISLLDTDVQKELPRLKSEAEKGELRIDRVWQAFAVQTLHRLNDSKDRWNKIPSACARIITARAGETLKLSPKDQEELEKAFKIFR